MKINKKDLLILTVLRNNSRQTLTKISQQTRVPISTIYDRLRQYQDNLIQKHTTLIDFNLVGFNTKANILMGTSRENRPELKNFLLNHPHVNNVYRINNGFDFQVEGVFQHMRSLEGFIDQIEERFRLHKKEVFFIINDLKREGFLTNPQSLQLIHR